MRTQGILSQNKGLLFSALSAGAVIGLLSTKKGRELTSQAGTYLKGLVNDLPESVKSYIPESFGLTSTDLDSDIRKSVNSRSNIHSVQY